MKLTTSKLAFSLALITLFCTTQTANASYQVACNSIKKDGYEYIECFNRLVMSDKKDDKLITVKKEGKFGLATKEHKIVIEPQYDTSIYFYDGLG